MSSSPSALAAHWRLLLVKMRNESQPASRPAAVVSFMPVAGARPRIVAAAEEQEAHLRRLATLRKKAGRTLWDEVVEPLVVEAAVG